MSYAFDFAFLADYWKILANGAYLTIRLTVISASLTLFLATGLALLKTYGGRAVRTAIGVYVELIRNTPILVQLLFVFFALPSAGLRLSPDLAAIVALVVNATAYTTEIIRAGIASVSRGQVEAGKSLGLSALQIFYLVILPPAIRAVFSALTTQFNVLLLNTAVVSAISAQELMEQAEHINSITFKNFEVYATVFVIYLLMTFSFSFCFRLFERKYFAYANFR